jgi:DNA-binding LacI/PurR family transcriptional regulator
MGIDFSRPMPLYLQIAEDIRNRIVAGQLKVGAQLDSHQKISTTYGDSLITVKKALSHLVQEGLLISRIGKGTYVAARQPRPVKVDACCIGLVLRDLQSPFFSLIVHAAEEAAYERGYNILLSNSSDKAEKEEAQIRNFRKIGVSGLIVASMYRVYRATPTIESLAREGFPFVMVSYMQDETIPFVGTDHELGGYIATRHLLGLGYRSIGYINAEEGNLVGELRKAGYLRALHEGQGEPEFLFRMQHRGPRGPRGQWNDFQSGYDIGKSFCSRARRPDAVFVYNDLSALGFEKAVLEAGLRVPEEIAIVGFDDIERGEYADVPLTTIRQPTEEIGRRAVDVLLRMIEGLAAPVRTILSPSLVVRSSCGQRLNLPQMSVRVDSNPLASQET